MRTGRRHPFSSGRRLAGAATTKTIQEALDLAVRGATVSVLPGTYAETLTIRRGLTLEATGGRSGQVIVAPAGSPETTIEIATKDPVTIRGITIDRKSTRLNSSH